MFKLIYLAKKIKGLTPIGLLIILGITGILVMIAIPRVPTYKSMEHDSQAKASLRSLFLACKSYWSENPPTSVCSLEGVTESAYGFVKDTNISVVISNGEEDTFHANAQQTGSSSSYSIDSLGNIIIS